LERPKKSNPETNINGLFSSGSDDFENHYTVGVLASPGKDKVFAEFQELEEFCGVKQLILYNKVVVISAVNGKYAFPFVYERLQCLLLQRK